MGRSAYLAFALLSFFGLAAENVNFDHDPAGRLPRYWSATQTHPGPAAEWLVRRDPAAPSKPNVLSQVSDGGARYEFNLAIFERVFCRDGDLSVKFRIHPGHGARTAGLVLRYHDPDNYYLLHFSADQHNVMLFHVEGGKAEPIQASHSKPGTYGVDHDIRPGVWYLGKIVFRGKRFRVMLGNRQLFEAQDDAAPVGGKTGVWTKGSTVASFDDFRIDPKD